MRNSFKGFYKPSEDMLQEAWSSESTLFALDTNVLLNLYGYAEQTRNDFFELLTLLGNKLWIPHQVGLEYQRRRLEIIRDEKAIFNKIGDNLLKIEKIFQGDFEQLALKRRFPKLHENTEKLHREINKSISAYKKSVSYWDDKQPGVRTHDSVREKLNELFIDKVGPQPESQEWLDGLYKEGKVRYENKIPPGYKDLNKSKSDESTFTYNSLKYDRQYGDLILWKQLINKAKEDNIKNVIFITDDTKEDWWYILDSRGKKQIGPHAELQSEIYREAELDIFHMYTTPLFLESGREILKSGVHDSSIQDANITFHQSISRANRIHISPRLVEFYSAPDDLNNYEAFKEFFSLGDSNNPTIKAPEFKNENQSLLYNARAPQKTVRMTIDPKTKKLIFIDDNNNEDADNNNENNDE